jgi:hypothetical protein
MHALALGAERGTIAVMTATSGTRDARSTPSSGNARPRLRRDRAWLAKNPGLVLTLSGLFVYGYLRLVLAAFYAPFGIRPEDVGFGYQQTLASSILLILRAAIAFALVALFLRAIDHLLQRRDSAMRLSSRFKKVCICIFATGFLFGGIFNAHLDGKDLAAGHNIHDFRVFGISDLYNIPHVASVSAASANVPLPFDLANAQSCLLFLGTADGVDVFYAPHLGQSIRVPVNLITVDVGGTNSGRVLRC